MSVTFTIRGNAEYCDANGLTRRDEVECLCTQGMSEPYPKCSWCKGTGVDVIVSYPYELTVSNANAAVLCSGLGVEPICGTIHPDQLNDRIYRVSCLLKTRLESTQLTRYIDRLKTIIREARLRGQSVVWG